MWRDGERGDGWVFGEAAVGGLRGLDCRGGEVQHADSKRLRSWNHEMTRIDTNYKRFNLVLALVRKGFAYERLGLLR